MRFTAIVRNRGCASSGNRICDIRRNVFRRNVAPELRTPRLRSNRDAALLDADVGELSAEECLLHQLASAVEMLFHPQSGTGGIAAGDRIDDRQMRLGGAGLKFSEVDAERHEPIDLTKAP